jgi:hypothetical protein
MKQATKLAVAPFENRNGSTSYRVIGWLHGERVRKNFKTREEASAERAALEIQSLQATHGMRSVPTTLSIEQVRDAEVAYRRLADNSPCRIGPSCALQWDGFQPRESASPSGLFAR